MLSVRSGTATAEPRAAVGDFLVLRAHRRDFDVGGGASMTNFLLMVRARVFECAEPLPFTRGPVCLSPARTFNAWWSAIRDRINTPSTPELPYSRSQALRKLLDK